MRILITSGASELAQQLATQLAPNHQVRLTDRSPATTEFEFAVAALGHDASTRLLLQDCDALLLLHQQGRTGESEYDLIDMATRGVYNLLHAAVEAGVRRVVCISTLGLMDAYAPEMTVSERWRPRPTTAPAVLAAYLTEATCREFAREHKLDVTVLRIGTLVADDAELTPAGANLRGQDLAHGVALALAACTRPWVVYHLQSQVDGARFSTAKAQEELGYLHV
ncbi:MAG: NAD(P)-dependent oxidoreductase [Litorilinea sp.]